MRLYHQTMRISRAYKVDDETESTVVKLLESCAKYEQDSSNEPIPNNNVKNQISNMLIITRPIGDELCYVPPRKPIVHLRRFICSYKADFADDFFRQIIDITKDELDYAKKHSNWFVKILRATQAQV